MKKNVLIGTGIAAAVLAVGGIWYVTTAHIYVDSKTYIFGGPKNINMLPIIAETQGYFEKNGLRMERKDMLTGGLTYDAVVNGEIDFGVIVDTNIAFTNITENPDVEVIAVIQEKSDDAIIASNSIQRPKDFEGKRIAVTPFTTSHAFAVFYLMRNGVDTSSVEFVHMSPPQIQEALIQGEIEAGSLWQPFRQNVVNARENQVRTFNDTEAYTGFAFVATRADFSRQNPKVVESFLEALLDAEEYVKGNLSESQNILSEEIGIPPEVLTSFWNEYSVGVSLSQGFLLTLEAEAKWAIQSKITTNAKIPNYLTYIYFDALEAVKPEAVSIIR